MDKNKVKRRLLVGMAIFSATIIFVIAIIKLPTNSKSEDKEITPLEELMPVFEIDKSGTTSNDIYLVKRKKSNEDVWLYYSTPFTNKNDAMQFIRQTKSESKIRRQLIGALSEMLSEMQKESEEKSDD